MTDREKIKIEHFLEDPVTCEAVKKVILKTFLKSSGSQDVNTLAAERIAINLLEDSFKELEKIKRSEPKSSKEFNQIGL